MRLSRLPAALAATLVLALAHASCGGSDSPAAPGDDDDDDDPPVVTTGSLQASVTADGNPRGGVSIRLVTAATGQTLRTQSTSTAGTTLFTELAAAAYDVQITVPSGFALATGESLSKRLTVTANNQTNTSFALVTSSSSNTQVINIQGFTFAPADVTIARGTTVQWVNPSSTLHTVTPQGHSEWSSATLATANSTFSHTFNTAGVYNYFCQPHQGAGMIGVIRVQ